MAKICPWTRRSCIRSSCDFLDAVGNVRVCKHHGNNHGIVTLRRAKPDLRRGVKRW